VIPASLLLSDSAMPDILLAGGIDVKAVWQKIDSRLCKKGVKMDLNFQI
jgi:hypothetical protein